MDKQLQNLLADLVRINERIYNYVKCETQKEPKLDDFAAMRDDVGKAFAVGATETIAIQLNSRACSRLCKLCGDGAAFDLGPALFMAGTEDHICDGCGRKYAPELVNLLVEHRRRC
jgi:hypothetical protein